MKARLALVALLVTTTAFSCNGNDPSGDKFTRDCTAKGGTVATHKQGNSTSRVCNPPPGVRWQ